MKDGGPAFPCEGVSNTEIGKEGIQMISRLPANGMSLRDWFAGMALVDVSKRGSNKTSELAHYAYQIADAMIKERKK